MEAYLLEWLNLFVRWLHFITCIVWIGSSLYFIWLDDHLQDPRPAVHAHSGCIGALWSVRGGGFHA